MSDRNELIQAIAHPDMRTPATSVRPPSCTPCNKAEQVADRLIAAGFRRTVTPEQIEAAAKANAELDGSRCFNMFHEDEQDDRDAYREGARAAARAFGLVPEDGEQ